jgi:hypothetical protein
MQINLGFVCEFMCKRVNKWMHNLQLSPSLFVVNTPLSTKILEIFLMILICMNYVVIRLIYFVSNVMCSVPEAHPSSCCNYTALRHSLGFIIFLYFVVNMFNGLKHWLCQKTIRDMVLWNYALYVCFMMRLFVILNYEIPANFKSKNIYYMCHSGCVTVPFRHVNVI